MSKPAAGVSQLVQHWCSTVPLSEGPVRSQDVQWVVLENIFLQITVKSV